MIHLVSTSAKYAMIFRLSAGNKHDAPEGRKLIESFYSEDNHYLLIDRAYEDDTARELAVKQGFIPGVPPKRNRKGVWIMIASIIQHFLKYSSFVKEFKEYYDSHHIKCDKEQYDVRYIKERLEIRGRTCIDSDDPNVYFVDNGVKCVTIHWDKKVKTGCYINGSNQGYRFTLKIEYENEVYERPLYDILNEYMEEEYFTDNIFSYNWRESDEIITFIVTLLSGIQQLSGIFFYKELYSFFSKSDFVEKYLELSNKCKLIEYTGYTKYKPDKEEILKILSELGYEGNYNIKERFCRVIKEKNGLIIGYNISFAYDTVTFIPFGQKDGKGLFAAPSMAALVQFFSSDNVSGLRYQSYEELKFLIKIMLGYLDDIIGCFE